MIAAKLIRIIFDLHHLYEITPNKPSTFPALPPCVDGSELARTFLNVRPEAEETPDEVFGTHNAPAAARNTTTWCPSVAFSATCAAIVQCAVSVEASSSTGASSDTAVAVVVDSSHSIGSGLCVLPRASTSSIR